MLKNFAPAVKEGTKTVFYNELTGVLMVRATAGDLEVVGAAIDTLGGVAR